MSDLNNTIIATGENVLPNANTKKLITVRDMLRSGKLEMGGYLTKINWSVVCGPLGTCESMWTSFRELVHSRLDIIMPEKQIRIHPTDAPCMNQKLKSLMLSRQKALHMHAWSVFTSIQILPEPCQWRTKSLQGEVLRISH